MSEIRILQVFDHPKVTVVNEEGKTLLKDVDVVEFNAAYDESAYNPHCLDNPLKLDNRFTYWGPRLQAWIQKRYNATLELSEVFWLASQINVLFREAKKKYDAAAKSHITTA